MSDMAKNWIKMAPCETNLVLFKISYSTFWLGESKLYNESNN